MKISSFDLKELIGTQKEALISEECPSPELIVCCVRQELSRKDRRKILDHISRCGQCAADAKAVLDIVDKENAVIQNIGSHLRSKDSNAGEKSISLRKFLRFPIPAALIIVVIVALGAYLVIGNSVYRSSRRGSNNEIILISPNQNSVAATGLIFNWRSYAGTKAYIVEVYNLTLALIWRSEAVSTTTFSPPSELIAKITRGVTYFWAVTAILENEAKVKSKLEKFSIQKPQT
jgi:hypothetical protein